MRWHRERWASRLRGLPDSDSFLDEIPPLVDRATISKVVLDAHDSGRTDLAFVAAMIWGYGPAGYGPFRTDRVLRGDGQAGVLTKLDEAAAIARNEGAVAGFYAMNNAPGRVRYLGPAFFTKWLYFTTATEGPDGSTAAPILDLRVQRWLARHAGISLRLDRTRDYARYLQLLDAWGKRPGGVLSRATVERAIFSLA